MAKKNGVSNREYYKFQVEKLKQDLDEQIELSKEQKTAYVLNAQKLHAERFLKDNERIWTVSTLFIPLSLAGLSSLQDKAFMTVLLLGMGSIALICFWYLASEKLREFQDENLRMVTVFNLYLGIDTSVIDVTSEPPEIEELKENPTLQERMDYWHAKFMILLKNTRIQQARLYMFRVVLALWSIAIVYSLLQAIIEAGAAFVESIAYPHYHH